MGYLRTASVTALAALFVTTPVPTRANRESVALAAKGADERYAERQRCKIVASEDQQQAPTLERPDRQSAFKSLQ